MSVIRVIDTALPPLTLPSGHPNGVLDGSKPLTSDELRRLIGARSDTPGPFKVILVGDSGAGKTSLILRAARDAFSSEGMKSTIGVDFFSLKYEVHGKPCDIQVWDTAGQEQFAALSDGYFRGAHAVLACFDISRSLGGLEKRVCRAKEITTANPPLLYMAGCKYDLARGVASSSSVSLAGRLGCLLCAETSSRDDYNVQPLFARIAADLMARWAGGESTGSGSAGNGSAGNGSAGKGSSVSAGGVIGASLRVQPRVGDGGKNTDRGGGGRGSKKCCA